MRQCVILVGGLGTRLGALTARAPKPLLPVGGRPFLYYLLWHARRFGFTQVLLLAGYKAEALVDELAGLAVDGLSLDVMIEQEPLGTGGAVAAAWDRLDDEFLLLNGDSIFDFNWLSLSDLMGATDYSVAMSLRSVPDASRYGVAELAGDRVVAFRERGDPGGGVINGGVYWVRRDAFAGFSGKGSFERDLLPSLAAQGRVGGAVRTGFFLDIGVPHSYDASQTVVPASLRRGAVFFDRDGVLNEDDGYVHSASQLRWVLGAVEAVRAANDRNMYVFVVTNQSGVARGYYEESDVIALHQAMQDQLKAFGAHIDDFRFCPHHPDGSRPGYAVQCDWRKPGAGMILDLAGRWPVDLGASLMIGDQPTDLQAAAAGGVRGVLFTGGRLDAALSEALKS